MIQATQNKTIDAKALKGAEGKVQGAELLDADSVEGQEFAKELKASLEEHVALKPVEISADQLIKQPSQLIEGILQEGNPEAVSPKVFDPAMTMGVEKIVQPQTTEAPVAPVALTDEQVLKLAKGEVPEVKAEITQALLKTPQLTQAGRSPAIEFAPNEIDPQLMNMDDFVLQKNLVNKKAVPTQGYGMKQEAQKELMAANGLKATEIVSELKGAEGSTSSSVNSQQFILNMMNEQGSPKLTEVQTPKVFDMSQVKTENASQILNQITDYIVQAKASKEPTVSMRMNHDDLGMIDITVTKTPGIQQDALAINIGAHSQDGKNFFQQNSKDLFSHLTTAGFNVSDLKVETPSQTAKNDFDMNHQGRQGQQGERHAGSEQNQRRQDSDRRQELWNLLKEDKEAA
jgi:hypothetical protein